MGSMCYWRFCVLLVDWFLVLRRIVGIEKKGTFVFLRFGSFESEREGLEDGSYFSLFCGHLNVGPITFKTLFPE